MPTVRAGDLDVHYTERGRGFPVVLLHGGLATADMWKAEHVATIAIHHRVLLPDSRGHGRTLNPASTLSYAQMADDVAAFCAALEISHPIIVGYSDGAQIAIEIGLRHPGLARAHVLGGVVIDTSPPYFELLASMGFKRPGVVDLDAMRAAFGSEHFEMMVTKPHANWEQLLEHISQLWFTVPTYTDEQLGRIKEPCLVMCGDRDRASLDNAVRLLRALGTAELAVVPASEHGAASKALFWTNVLDFLTRH